MSDDHQPVDEGELYDSNCVGGARHVCDTKGAKITYNSNEDGDIDFQDCVVELGGQESLVRSYRCKICGRATIDTFIFKDSQAVEPPSDA